MSLSSIFGGLSQSQEPWSELPNLGDILGSAGGGAGAGLGTIVGTMAGGGTSTASQAVGVNSQALSGPLNASDLWRMVIALMIFVLIADSIPGDTGIWWGLLSLMAMAAIYYSNTDTLITGIKNYLAGEKYQA